MSEHCSRSPIDEIMLAIDVQDDLQLLIQPTLKVNGPFMPSSFHRTAQMQYNYTRDRYVLEFQAMIALVTVVGNTLQYLFSLGRAIPMTVPSIKPTKLSSAFLFFLTATAYSSSRDP